MQGPRLYRFFNYEVPLYLPAPTGGWNPDAQPWEVPLDQATALDNFLFRPGKILMRGPMVLRGDYTAQAPANACGVVLFPDGQIRIDRKSTAGGQVDPWNAPLVRGTAGQAASANTTSIGIAANGTVSTFAISVNDALGPRIINFYGNIFGLGYTSSSAAVPDSNGNYSVKPGELKSVGPGSISGTTGYPQPPHGAFDLIGYQSRLWLLGGIDTPGGGTTHSPITLFFTNPLTNLTGSVSEWRDPVSGLTNQILLDGDALDYGVGLAHVRNGLLVLRRSSIYLLRGSTTQSYQLVPISKEVGCVDARSIVEADNGVYFLSKRGLMFTNGVSVVNVSGPLMYTLQQAIHYEQQQVIALNGGYCTAVMTAAGQIAISIGVGVPSGPPRGVAGSYQPIFTALYDPNASKSGGWVRLTSNVFNADGNNGNTGNQYGGMLYGIRAPKQTVSIGDQYAVALEDELNNTSILDPSGGPFDIGPAGAQKYRFIPSVWETTIPAITVASRRVIGLAKRYYADYQFTSPGNAAVTNAWNVAVVDSTGAQMDTVALPMDSNAAGFANGGILASATNVIMRYNRDFTKEIQDIRFIVSAPQPAYQPSGGRAIIADVYGLGLEFQRSRELR